MNPPPPLLREMAPDRSTTPPATRIRRVGMLPWLAALLVGIMAVGAARLALLAPIGFPVCGLRALTGLPCPFCGSTRCLAALSRLEFSAAAGYNPLVAAGCVMLAIWLAAGLAGWVVGWGRELRWPEAVFGKRWLAVWAALLVLNWVYLLLSLPR